ncbi:kinesin-domain-containing protein [Suhomyces tanzawaensis NRRL Y-17324]|uniref:Kinesin-domain-containing protein n=1 Tax=Suhomyces tanzawaensis NRRL Y-17324 TaxID=984487 RepID=A0A1E4SD45_9ASCO|nr:kinesin-domain-containing protein [Suhomyces tanzawaensis NRRL Y-17324]ODV77388.1 kinesin-domain-containing protein [Suhomyces tanzawaensis NRRL Y-17324]
MPSTPKSSSPTPEDNSIKVLVRVRPLLPREIPESGQDVKSLVSMPANDSRVTRLEVPASSTFSNQKSKVHRPSQVESSDTSEDVKTYHFDESIWSYDLNDAHYVSNKQFYTKTGPSVLNHFFQGFNVCLLAYGQTSSGKTFTMMGNKKEPGIIPLVVRDILRQKEILIGERINCEVKLSYMEIYNEQVKDLLGNQQGKMRVREHPTTGPYVENLSEFVIDQYEDFEKYLKDGNIRRATASTSMNEQSSRSHAILTLTLKQTKFNLSDLNESIGEAEEEMISNIKLVDLAGSERLSKTKVYGQQDRIKEGTLINKSLTVLGRCINLLSSPGASAKSIPYRDSILTYILRENLGGNSKTLMIFCISPIDFDETHQTLNYATQVKRIKTTAKANKTKLATVPIDWNQLETNDQDVVSSLKNEIQELTAKLNSITIAEDESRFAKLMNYLEKETSKVKFENKFLKQQLHQKTAEVAELSSHVTYLEHEVGSLTREVVAHQHQSLARSKDLLLESCQAGEIAMGEQLAHFDPATFF